MAKRTGPQPPAKPPLRLRVSADDARSRLADRADKGRKLKDIPINSWETLDGAKKEYDKWSSYNSELLKQLFTSDELSNEYDRFYGAVIMERNLGRDIREFHEEVGDKIHRLESIAERLELIPLSDEITAQLDATAIPSKPTSTSRVFIVHGHDEAVRESVARFLERLDLQPIILHEQANEGMTVIEKLERHSDVRFAVVLLTPDDEGRSVAAAEALRLRARQNVVLELGYFSGKLGRKAVCALHRGSIELPSNYLGVVYIPIDEGGGWQLRLAKELKAAGFSIDMNRAF
jgi:predicted nucleotide-binding protein